VSLDEDPAIGEPALRGADTCGRAKIVWQVRTLPLHKKHELFEDLTDGAKVWENWDGISRILDRHPRGHLKARAGAELPNAGSPLQGGYRGLENQLYRVEIHEGGEAGEGAMFKWSRENGSVVLPIVAPVEGNTVTLGRWSRDRRSNLQAGDWVEISDDATALHTAPQPLLQVQQIHSDLMQVVLSGTLTSNTGQDLSKHPVLRRWDQKPTQRKNTEEPEGAIPIREGEGERNWIALENGIEIQFQETPTGSQNHYRSGDYWLIPARSATGGIDWPASNGEPEAAPPHGIDHHYGPLAILEFQGSGVLHTTGNCRRTFHMTHKFTID
jgi:hypothetical protein